MHSFKTERLLIRPLSIEDKALFISLYTDAKIMRNIVKPLTPTKAERSFYKTIEIMKKEKPTTFVWVIVTLLDNKAIGIQALSQIKNKTCKDKDTNQAEKHIEREIGIMLLRKSNGRLLPEEAIGSLIEYGFNNLGVTKISAYFSSKNLATARVSKKTGFIREKQTEDATEIIESVYKSSWQGQYISSFE